MSNASRSKVKWILGGVLLLALAIAVWLTLFGPRLIPKRDVIAVSLPSEGNPFWIDVRRGAEEGKGYAKGYTVEIRSTSAEQDARAQALYLRELVTRRDVAAVVVGPAHKSEPIEPLAELQKQGVAIVVIDTKLDAAASSKAQLKDPLFIGSDNFAAARKAADVLHAELKRRGVTEPFNVLVLEGDRVHQSGVQRADGFYERAKELGMKYEAIQARWLPNVAQEQTTLKFSTSKYDALFAGNDEMAIGAIKALENFRERLKPWPVILGFDYTLSAREQVDKGNMFGSMKQDPVRMGRDGVRFAAEIAARNPNAPSGDQWVPVDLATGK